MIRAPTPQETLSPEQTAEAYNRLSHVERALRRLKSVDLEIRAINHRVSERVKAHIFLRMPVHDVEWQIKRMLAPPPYAEENQERSSGGPEGYCLSGGALGSHKVHKARM